MRKIAVLSDIHGNLPALTSVLHEVEAVGCQAIWCLGDTVGYGPEPRACYELINRNAELVLLGNHEAGVCGRVEPFDSHDGKAAPAMRLARAQFEADEEGQKLLWAMRELPAAALLSEQIAAYHASPVDALWHFVTDNDSAFLALSLAAAPFVLVGHSHRQSYAVMRPEGGARFERRKGELQGPLPIRLGQRLLVNPGSVGLSGSGKAEWGILTVENGLPLSFEWRQNAIAEQSKAA